MDSNVVYTIVDVEPEIPTNNGINDFLKSHGVPKIAYHNEDGTVTNIYE